MREMSATAPVYRTKHVFPGILWIGDLVWLLPPLAVEEILYSVFTILDADAV